MSPRCLPDVSQMSPRCLRDVSHMSSRCLPDVFQISPRCLPDVSQMSSQFPPYPGGVTDGLPPGPQRIWIFCFFGGLEMESRQMCKMWVWTAPAWSDCMYTLPKNTLDMGFKIMICLIIFETFTEEGQSCCQGMSMGCQGAAP